MVDADTKRRMVVGTKAAIEKGTGDFRVVCATCGYGGGTQYPTMADAFRVATSLSDRACRACGAK